MVTNTKARISTKAKAITETIDGAWKIMEYWRGSFLFIDYKKISATNWGKIRENIISYCKEGAEKFIEQLKVEKKINSVDKIRIIQPEDEAGKMILDSFDLPLKYIQFPLFWLFLGRFKCKVGVRINVCANPNLSKIFIYLITTNETNNFTNRDLQEFRDLAKEYVERLDDEVFKIYKNAIYKKTHVTIKRTPYYLELYNLGSTSKLIREFVRNDNIEQMKELLKYSEVKHAYYTMLSLAGENFDINKNIGQLKKELKEQPKQALIPSSYPCDSFRIQSLFAQPESGNNKPILLAGITAIELDTIRNIDRQKVQVDKTSPQSPFCRAKNQFTSLEAWHHSNSHQIITSFATL